MNLHERFLKKKILHLSHTDLDGISCVIVSKFLLSATSKIDFITTDDRTFSEFDFSSLKNYDYLLITDLALTKEIYSKLASYDIPIVMIDHHISGWRELEGTPDYYFEENKAGVKLLYNAITEGCTNHNTALQQFVDYCDCYDLWRTEDPLWDFARKVSDVMHSSRNKSIEGIEAHSKFIDTQLLKFTTGNKYYFTMKEKMYLAQSEKRTRIAYNMAKKNLSVRLDGMGFEYGFTSASSKISIISNALLKDLTSIKYICILDNYVKGSNKLSLRCRGDFDVSKIAEVYGGGGHQQAAGCSVSDEFLAELKAGRSHLI